MARCVVSSVDLGVFLASKEASELLVLDGQEVLELGPDDGALVPVKRVTLDLSRGLVKLSEKENEALLSVEGKVGSAWRLAKGCNHRPRSCC